MVCPDPWISYYGSGWLYRSALQFIARTGSTVPEVLAEIKTALFDNAFCLLFLQLELSLNAI